MKVALLHDDVPSTAREDELDVFVQADAVAEALGELGCTAVRVPFPLDLRVVMDDLARHEPDLVFNLVESISGHGRLIHVAPALLDALRIPYTGASAEAMFLTSNKLLSKQFLDAHEIATPQWLVPDRRLPRLPKNAQRYIIKSVWEHASVGMDDDAIVEVKGAAALEELVRQRAERLGGDAFAEQYIAGREFNLSLLASSDGVDVLPPAEIQFVDYPDDKPRVVGYRAKWESQSFEYHHTPRTFDFPGSDGALLRRLCELARRCWELFDLHGYARVDFRVDEDGQPWVLEINANPCLSPDAGFVAATQRAELRFTEVIGRVLADTRRGAPVEGA